MNLLRALRLASASASPCIAFVGAGGKTSAIFQLARQIPGPVFVTTTTHFGVWQIPLADRHILAAHSNDLTDLPLQGVTLFSAPADGDRLTALPQNLLRELARQAHERHIPLLIEADGARGLSLKAPAEHEPALPDFVDTVVVVAGLNGLGQPLDVAHVHRPQRFSALSGLALGAEITPEGAIRVLLHPDGGLKNIPTDSRRICLLNQADTPEVQAIAGQMSEKLVGHYDSVVIASLQEKRIHSVHENIAGIILAAGQSTRFGQPKQLLDWHGEPFVRAVARKALAAGLSPVVVVTGANADEVEAAVNDLDVRLVRNQDWASGQGRSIALGVASLPRQAGGGVFLLSDQPQVSVEVIRALLEYHRSGMPAIVAPLILEERRANPVLFDRVTFEDLRALQGDVGGRAIFHKHKVEFLPWHDDALLLDVDTPEDYRRLIDGN